MLRCDVVFFRFWFLGAIFTWHKVFQPNIFRRIFQIAKKIRYTHTHIVRALEMKHSQHLAGKFCLGRCRGNALGFAAKRAADVNSEVWVNFHIHLY